MIEVVFEKSTLHSHTGLGQSTHPSWQLISHGQSQIFKLSDILPGSKSYSLLAFELILYYFTFNAQGVSSQAITNASKIVRGAVHNAVEGLFFT